MTEGRRLFGRDRPDWMRRRVPRRVMWLLAGVAAVAVLLGLMAACSVVVLRAALRQAHPLTGRALLPAVRAGEDNVNKKGSNAMKRTRRYLAPGVLAVQLLVTLLPESGQAAMVSENSTARGALYFKTSGAPENITVEMFESLEPGWVSSDQNMGMATVTLPTPGTGVALRPWEEVVGGDHEDGFVLTSRDDPSHTLKFDTHSPIPGGVWQGGWLYQSPDALWLDDHGNYVMEFNFIVRGGQTLSAGHYPLVLEVGTWTP